MIYRYCWSNNEKRRTLFMRRCRVLAYGRRNSALVKFRSGQREIVSRFALRRIHGT